MTGRRLLVLLLLLALPQRAHAAPREHVLGNGLKVLIDSDRSRTGVDVAVWYATGLADEPAGRSGLTHLMERLMFRGSPRFAAGEYARRMAARGATFNTFLAPDFSEFYATGPSEALGEMLALEADRMAGQKLTAANVAAETRAIADEQKRLEENPVTKGLQQLYATAFGAHPYALPLQGRAADRAKLTPAAVAEYAKTRYAPSNALLTIVGDVDPDSAVALATRAFGAIPRREASAARSPALPASGEKRGRARAPIRLAMAGWRAPADSACGPELAVLAQALGGGTAPRLAAQLAAKQRVALTASCVFDGRRLASLFYATAAIAPAGDSAAAEQALITEVERFATEPLTAAQLESARKSLLIAERIERQGVRGRAQSLGVAEIRDGRWSFSDAQLARVAALTAADVQRVAAQVLVPENRTVVWTVPPPANPARAAAASAAPRKGGR